MKKRYSTDPTSVPRHVKERETPLAIYLAIKVHSSTRSKQLVNTLHSYGLCISYDRLQKISRDIANSVIAHFEQEGIVVPMQALKNVLTIVYKDNIDVNTRAKTARSDFHGDSYSILQFPSLDNPGEPLPCNFMNSEVMGKSSVDPIPESYTVIKDLSLPKRYLYTFIGL